MIAIARKRVSDEAFMEVLMPGSAGGDVAPRVSKTAVLRPAYFETAMSLIRESQSLVERLYMIDRDGGFDTLRPISPPSESISLIRCPFAGPPIEGLHGISAILSRFIVINSVLRPIRALASGASQPA